MPTDNVYAGERIEMIGGDGALTCMCGLMGRINALEANLPRTIHPAVAKDPDDMFYIWEGIPTTEKYALGLEGFDLILTHRLEGISINLSKLSLYSYRFSGGMSLYPESDKYLIQGDRLYVYRPYSGYTTFFIDLLGDVTEWYKFGAGGAVRASSNIGSFPSLDSLVDASFLAPNLIQMREALMWLIVSAAFPYTYHFIQPTYPDSGEVATDLYFTAMCSPINKRVLNYGATDLASKYTWTRAGAAEWSYGPGAGSTGPSLGEKWSRWIEPNNWHQDGLTVESYVDPVDGLTKTRGALLSDIDIGEVKECIELLEAVTVWKSV
jgi:hypothetical protein